jgi:TP901 family phage tail tape measure protein
MATSIPKSIKATLYIDGKPAAGTMKNLESVTQRLNKELRLLEVGTEAWNRKMKEVKMHQKALNGLKDEIKGTAGAFGFLKTEIGKFGALAAGYLGFQFITDKFRNVIMANADLSDSIADVRKTTGLSEVAVRRLNSEFKKIDTRSSRDELNGLARIAGKLGISAEQDILGFVRAADKISVALGEDLGGAEEAINSLGKLVEIFKIKDQFGLEQALLNVGSSINELGAVGTANEGYIVEFTKRLAGIAPAANMSIQDVLALGAVMDELGQPVESSATAIGQFIVGLGQDIPKFANIAGKSIAEFSDLLKNDGNQALIAVLKNVDSTGAGVAGLAANMGMLGEDGARAIQALGSLSANMALLEKRQKLSNDEFERGLSLTEEFNVKNNTFGATLAKLQKKIGQFTSNFAFQDFLVKITLAFSSGIDFINRNGDAIGRWMKIIVIAGSAILTYRTYLLLANTALFQFIATLITGEKAAVLSRTATIALSGAKALLSGNLTKATQAWRLLNITMAANPAGAILAGIVAITLALTMFNSKLGIAAQSQKNMNEITAQAESATINERLAIDRLLKVLGDENKSKAEKLSVVNELRRIMPEVLKGYSDEEIMAGRATGAIREQVKALVAKAKAGAALAKISDLESEKIDINKEMDAGPGKAERIAMGFNKTITGGLWDPLAGWMKTRNNRLAEIKALQDELETTLEKEETTITKFEGGTATPSAIKTLDSLNKKVDELKQKQRFVTIGSKEFIALSKEILAIESEINSFNPKTQQTNVESAQEKALKEFEKLGDNYKNLNLQRLNDQLSANEKEVKQEEDKFQKLIDQEKKFLEMKGATPKQKEAISDNIKQLEADKEKAIIDLRARQEEDLLIKIRDLRTQLTNIHETELQKQKDQINKFYNELEKDNAGNETLLANLREQRLIELGNAEIREKENLEKEKLAIEAKYDTISGNKAENYIAGINKKYDDEILALKEKFSKELQATKEFKDAVDAINTNRDAEITARTKATELDKKNFAIEMAQVASDTAFNIMSNNNRAKSEANLSQIEKQRNAELSNKELTESQKNQINAKYDAQVKSEKERAWKAEQRAAIAQAIINGALAVTKVMAQTGILSPFVIPAIIAGTLAQVAVIALQKAPQFAQGGFSDDDPAGFVNQDTLFRKSSSGRPFRAGEAGREWIAPNWMLENPRTANIIGMLESARKSRGFAAGGSNGDPVTVNSTVDLSELTLMMGEMIRAQREANDKEISLNTRLLDKHYSDQVRIYNDLNA